MRVTREQKDEFALYLISHPNIMGQGGIGVLEAMADPNTGLSDGARLIAVYLAGAVQQRVNENTNENTVTQLDTYFATGELP